MSDVFVIEICDGCGTTDSFEDIRHKNTDMSKLPQITPTDADFDDMHHALGRPLNARSDTYRNYYCCGAESDTAKRFEAIGWWHLGRRINDGRDAIYHVNGAGKQALEEWLMSRPRKAKP